MPTARLKDRNRQIPNGFMFTQSETGFDSLKALGRHPSFDRLVAAVLAHRQGNKALARKHKWALDETGVAMDVENFNVALCLAHGWHDYVVSLDPANIPKAWPAPRAAGGVAAVKKTTAGVKLVVEWLGSGLKPVPIELAEKRAKVCAECPQNQEGGFFEKIGALAAQEIKTLLEIKNDLALKTTRDGDLKSCMACMCFNRLKVWVPLEHIRKNTSEEVKGKLDANCWVLTELRNGVKP